MVSEHKKVVVIQALHLYQNNHNLELDLLFELTLNIKDLTGNIKVKKKELSCNLVYFENASGRKDYFYPSMYFKCQSLVGQAFIFFLKIYNKWLWFWQINVLKTEWWFWDQKMENLLKHDLCTNISIIRGLWSNYFQLN